MVKMSNGEQRRLFFGSPPTLQTLASQELALEIFNIVVGPGIKLISFTQHLENCPNPMIEGVPRVIESMINGSLHNTVGPSFQKWCVHHKECVFFDASDEYFHKTVLKCIKQFVWKPNGTINYLQSAKNLLNGDELNVVEKFRFACINCQVDDIKRFWPFASDESIKRIHSSHWKKSPLIAYWMAAMEGEVKQLRYRCRNFWDILISSLEKFEWTTVEFVLNSVLPEGMNIPVVECWILEREPDLFCYLFSTLSDKQLRKMLKKIPIGLGIFAPMINDFERYSELIFVTWDFVKNFISMTKFAEVICTFIVEGFKKSHAQEIDSTLFELWISAPVYLRNDVLSDLNIVCSFFRKLVQTRPECTVDMEFFLAVLSDISFESRNLLWYEFWPVIILHANLSSLQRMMRLCLNNDEEIAQFKERDMMNLSNIEDFCRILIENDRVAELEKFLNFCSSNKRIVVDSKRQILQSTNLRAQIRCLIERNSTDMDNFIDSAFLNEEDAENYKSQSLRYVPI